MQKIEYKEAADAVHAFKGRWAAENYESVAVKLTFEKYYMAQ